MWERLQQLKKRRFESNDELQGELKTNKEFALEVKELAAYYLGKTPSACKNCLSDFYHELKRINKMGDNKEFTMLPGKVAYFKNGRDLSRLNLTDEKALDFLEEAREASKEKDNKKIIQNALKRFEKYPKNWSAMIDERKAKAKKAAEEADKKAAEAKAKEEEAKKAAEAKAKEEAKDKKTADKPE